MPPPTDKIKVSQLPLLFAKGNPTSLEMMNLEELQVFLRFVIKCELNQRGPPDLDNIDRPPWWPQDLEFSESILMKQKENRRKLSLRLKHVIRSCYNYNKCGFLIDFCRKLVEHTGGVENLEVRDNKNGTRSILKRADNKLLVTFKAENQDYDKHQNVRKPKLATNFSPVKRMLWSKPDNTSDPAMSNCTTTDIYLCDTCDKDFDSLIHLISHEKTCGKEEIIIDLEEKPAVDRTTSHTARSPCQEPLMTYLRLRAQGTKPPPPRKLKNSERPKAASYDKFMDIDVASPLGSYIISSSRLQLNQQNQSVRGFQSAEDCRKKQESYCPGTFYSLRDSNAFKDSKTKYPVVNKKRRKPAWVHIYCFTDEQRRERLRDIRNGLTPAALRHWRFCHRRGKAQVRLEKLPASTWKPKLEKYLALCDEEGSNQIDVVKKDKKRRQQRRKEQRQDNNNKEALVQFNDSGPEFGSSNPPSISPRGSVGGASGPSDPSGQDSDITISDSELEVMPGKEERIRQDNGRRRRQKRRRGGASRGGGGSTSDDDGDDEIQFKTMPGTFPGSRPISSQITAKQTAKPAGPQLIQKVYAVYLPQDEIDSTLDVKPDVKPPVIIPPRFRDPSLKPDIECVTISSDDD